MIVNCSVCDLELEEREDFARIDDEGDVYHLCSSRCLEDFEQEPEQYAAWQFEEQEAAESR